MTSRVYELARREERTEVMSLPDEAKEVLNSTRDGMVNEYYPSKGYLVSTATYAPYGTVGRPAPLHMMNRVGLRLTKNEYAIAVTVLLIFEIVQNRKLSREAWQVPLLIKCDAATHLPLSVFRIALQGPVSDAHGNAFLH